MTEHSVERPEGSETVRTTRRVFRTADGRLLGTETIRHTRHAGWDGTQWYEESPTTVAFQTDAEATAWIDEMFREHDVAQVAANGGTKLVIVD